MTEEEVFIHPLAESDVLVDGKGQEQDVANTWLIASMFWGAYLMGNENANAVVCETFQDDLKELKRLTEVCGSSNQKDVEGANLKAIDKIKFTLEEKIEAAFAE
jgi:hypothetical protein